MTFVTKEETLIRSAVVLAGAVAAAVAVAGPTYAAGHPAGVAAAPAVQTVVLTIRPVQAAPQSSGKESRPDERVDGANFAVRPGVLVRVVVWNYTDQLHSFASHALGVNAAILPGSLAHPHKAVFTFVAHTYGKISWYCAVPCGGHMGGIVYAIVR